MTDHPFTPEQLVELQAQGRLRIVEPEPPPLTRDDVRAMEPEAVRDALRDGQVDHLLGRKAAS